MRPNEGFKAYLSKIKHPRTINLSNPEKQTNRPHPKIAKFKQAFTPNKSNHTNLNNPTRNFKDEKGDEVQVYSQNKKHPRTTNLTNQYNKSTKPNPQNQITKIKPQKSPQIPNKSGLTNHTRNFKDENGEGFKAYR